MWEKPSYEIIEVCAEVTAYVYKDSGDKRSSVDNAQPQVATSSTESAGARHGSAPTAESHEFDE